MELAWRGCWSGWSGPVFAVGTNIGFPVLV